MGARLHHRVKIRQLNDEIARLQAQRDEVLRRAREEGVDVQDARELSSFEALRRASRRRIAAHVVLALAGMLAVVGAFVLSGAVDPQSSIAVLPLVAIAGGTLMATSIGAAARAARAHPEHF